jgi:predicted nucleic acid-binding protein
MNSFGQRVSTRIPLLDSSVLIAYFLREKTATSSEQYLKYGGYLTTMVLSETSNFIQQKKSTDALLKFMQKIFAEHSLYHCLMDYPDVMSEAYEILLQYRDNSLSLTDCYTLAQAERYGLRVVTHDARMASYKNVEVVVVSK